jgi:GntR family transcriptional regulator
MYRLSILDRGSVLPLYYQIQQNLLGDIRVGLLKPGQLVPSEQEISQTLRVSRMTARQALKSLCDLGVVYSERGKGTFVSPLKFERKLRDVSSFTEEMRSLGLTPRAKILSFETVTPSSEVAAALQMSAKEPVYRLRRLRIADRTPMGIECSYLPKGLYPELQQKLNPANSLYQLLADSYGIHMHVAEEVAEAALVDSRQARLLDIPKGSPVFVFSRTSYDRSGRPVEYVRSVYRGDRYKIVNRLSAKSSGGPGRNVT